MQRVPTVQGLLMLLVPIMSLIMVDGVEQLGELRTISPEG
jgi:hypothetical protein